MPSCLLTTKVHGTGVRLSCRVVRCSASDLCFVTAAATVATRYGHRDLSKRLWKSWLCSMTPRPLCRSQLPAQALLKALKADDIIVFSSSNHCTEYVLCSSRFCVNITLGLSLSCMPQKILHAWECCTSLVCACLHLSHQHQSASRQLRLLHGS